MPCTHIDVKANVGRQTTEKGVESHGQLENWPIWMLPQEIEEDAQQRMDIQCILSLGVTASK